MKRFLLKLLTFILIFLLYDKLFLIIVNKSADVEVDKRLEYLLNGQVNNDIIIAGSSTGSRDIIASKIEDETGLTCYNLCYPGSDVEFHDFIVRTLVEFNDIPKILFLMIDDDVELFYHETISFRKDRLYPLIKYPYIWEELTRRENGIILFRKISVLQRINLYNFDLRTKQFSPMDTIRKCGSMPISWKRENFLFSYDYRERNYEVDNEIETKLNALHNIVDLCEDHGIELVFVSPPVFQKFSKSFEKRIRQIGEDRAKYFIYNQTNPIYRDPDYFFDRTHLLENGANVFTQEIISFLESHYPELVSSYAAPIK